MSANPREIAEEITDYLFVSERPQETATRLVLERPGQKIEGAGWCREAVRDVILDRLESLSGNGSKPKKVRPIAKPGDKGRVARILNELDKHISKTTRETAISTAELDRALYTSLNFVASTSTQISKLRAWYESQGIGTIKRIDSRQNGVRVCRYWLERMEVK